MSFQEPHTVCLEPDAEPDAAERSTNYWRKDAVMGSHALLSALARANGDAPPPPIKTVTFATPGLPERKIETCECCGSPLANSRMLIATIQAAVSAYYRIDPAKMVSAQRSRAYAHPRQIAMYFASELTPKSLPEIGRRFGGRDHTTVLYGIRQVKRRIETDAEVAADVAILRAKLCPEVPAE
jgi:hypothetical protein